MWPGIEDFGLQLRVECRLGEDVKVASHDCIGDRDSTGKDKRLGLFIECRCVWYWVAFLGVWVEEAVVNNWVRSIFKAIRIGNHISNLLSEEHLQPRQACHLRRYFQREPWRDAKDGFP